MRYTGHELALDENSGLILIYKEDLSYFTGTKMQDDRSHENNEW